MESVVECETNVERRTKNKIALRIVEFVYRFQ